MKGGDPRRKPSDHMWSPNDDALLKSFIDKYPYNWYLIAECFNASRVTTSMDKRSPRDCLERWREKWGSELRLRQTEAGGAPTEITSPSTSQMTTRGVKRQAVASPTNGIAAPGTEPRKRRRHLLMQDTIRKYAKKRIETLQKANGEFTHVNGRPFIVCIAQRKPSIIHETHGQYAKLPKLSPAELIRLKVERDAREHQELLARKVIQARLSQQASLPAHSSGRSDPLQGSQILQSQQPQVAPQQQSPLPQQGTPQQQQLPAPSTIARPPSIGMPGTQGVPQIRAQVNISQQQRIAAALATANARLSPQQMQVQVQGRPGAVGQGAQGQGQVAAVGTAGSNNGGGSPRGYYVGGMTAEQLSRLQMLVSENKV